MFFSRDTTGGSSNVNNVKIKAAADALDRQATPIGVLFTR